jgi:hypothetical protein
MYVDVYQAPVFAQTPDSTHKSFSNNSYTFKIFENTNHTYGYDIFNKNIHVIHQPTIPARPGLLGFKTPKDAEKVAKLTIIKITNGTMPPSISEEELKTLKL